MAEVGGQEGAGPAGGHGGAAEEPCAARGIGAGLSGAVMGGVWGAASGLFKKPRTFKSVFAEAGSSAKTFATISAVHSVVVCYLRKVRQKDDPIHAGIAGCATGLILGWGGSPLAVLQSCAIFGGFGYAADVMNTQPAVALQIPASESCSFPTSRKARRRRKVDVQNDACQGLPALPPFTLPWSHLHTHACLPFGTPSMQSANLVHAMTDTVTRAEKEGAPIVCWRRD